MRLTSPALLAAAVASGACAAARPEGFTCPAQGGPAWVEVRTEHFQLRTDLPGPRAVALASELEAIRASHQAFFRGGAPVGLVPVTVFRSMRGLVSLGLRPRQALTLVDEAGARVVIAATPLLIGGSASQRAEAEERHLREGAILAAVSRHELAHVFVHRAVPGSPPSSRARGSSRAARSSGGRRAAASSTTSSWSRRAACSPPR